jgi:transcriptional regulator of aromatic amino acid metabolism
MTGAVGVSPAMRALERQLALMAQSERTTVLLTGESGTGKGRVARLLHAASPRGAGPFVEVNCGGLTATFLDDELFGHERGAFTDAKQSKRGLFEVADGGTLFLDEIGDLAPALQPKLLKVLETRRFRRLGGTRELSADVRLLVATHRDLQGAVGEGTFREDLYYRIGVTVVHLPPVRERSREDRLSLIPRVLSELAGEVPGLPTELTGEALERLLARQRARDAQRARARYDHGTRPSRDRARASGGRSPRRSRRRRGAADRGGVAQGHRAAADRTGAQAQRRQPDPGRPRPRDLPRHVAQEAPGLRLGLKAGLA